MAPDVSSHTQRSNTLRAKFKLGAGGRTLEDLRLISIRSQSRKEEGQIPTCTLRPTLQLAMGCNLVALWSVWNLKKSAVTVRRMDFSRFMG